MLQHITDDGLMVMQNEEVLQMDIATHSIDDVTAPFALLPYPATITRAPFVRIHDTDARRRWEFNQRKWEGNRKWDIVKSIVGDQIQTRSLWRTLAEGVAKNERPSLGALWRRGIFLASPGLARLVGIVLQFKQLKYDGYESLKAPPDLNALKSYDYTIPELTASITRIADTRANGARADQPFGMTTSELSRSEYPQDGALLYWLVYGEGSTLKMQQLKQMRPPEPEGAEQRLESLTTTPSWWWNQNRDELTGNLFDDRGLDPRLLCRTYVSYDVIVDVEETPGAKVRSFNFRALQCNAVDAGLLLMDIKNQVELLRIATDKMKARLESMSTYGYNWMHRELFVVDTTTNAYFGGINGLWRTSETRDQLRQQWKALSSEQRARQLDNTPLIINVQSFVDRMERIIGKDSAASGSQLFDTRYGQVRRIWDTEPGELESFVALDKLLLALTRLYCAAHSVRWVDPNPTSAPRALLESRSFWRWVEHYCPYLPSPELNQVVSTFIPPPNNEIWASGDNEPVLLRRLPQIGTPISKLTSAFGLTSIIPVRAVPNDALSERKNAKAAVDAAKQCWRTTINVYGRIRWVVEANDSYGRASCFHFVQLYAAPTLKAKRVLNDAPTLSLSNAFINVLGAHGGIPTDVASSEHAAVQSSTWRDDFARRAASGSVLGGDAALLNTFGLGSTRDSVNALQAWAALVATRAVAHLGTLSRETLVRSCVQEASAIAQTVVQIIDALYGEASKTSIKELVSRNDILFSCIPAADYVCVVLHANDAWYNAQTSQTVPPLWTNDMRSGVSKFAKALGKAAVAKVSPTEIPVIALQSTWIAINPTIERLRRDSATNTAHSGLEWQVRAAVDSFRRVRMLLGNNADQLVEAALTTIVSSRPIVLAAWTLSARGVRFTGTGSVLVERQPPNPQKVDTAKLRTRCATLRVDTVLKTAQGPADDPADTVADLLQRMAVTTANNGVYNAAYHVPPGAPVYGQCKPLDLSYSPQLDDMPVWTVGVVRTLAIHTFFRSSPAVATTWPLEIEVREPIINGHAMHPQRIDTNRKGWTVFMSQLPPLLKEMQAPQPFAGSSKLDTVENIISCMQKRRELGQASLSWGVNQRSRSLMWNVDRCIQLSLLMHLYPRAPHPVIIVPGASWSNEQVAALGVACALACAILEQQLVVAPQLVVYASTVQRLDAVQSALRNMNDMFAAPRVPSVAPLYEVALSLTTKL